MKDRQQLEITTRVRYGKKKKHTTTSNKRNIGRRMGSEVGAEAKEANAKRG